jgi:phenylacetate-CoA ligase
MEHQPTIAFAELAIQHQYQEEKLKELLQYLNTYAPFYQQHFLKHGIDINSIQSLDDLVQLPTTSKKDIQVQNWDFLCVDKESVQEIMATSGSLGKPVFIALTSSDLERLAYNEMLSFLAMNLTNKDTVQLMLTLDRQFMAGIAYYSGLQKIGSSIIRTGASLPAMQWDTILQLQPTALVAVPSFLVKMIDYALENGIDLNATSPKKILVIGENIRNKDMEPNTLAKKITQHWHVELFGTYAATEMQTGFTECTAHIGGHLQPELIIAEILDEQGLAVLSGAIGEVTITTLGVKGMPLLRYRTGDLCKAYYEPCTCGRKSMRIGPVMARKEHMLKFKGTSIFPTSITEMLNEALFIKDYVIEVRKNDLENDDICIYIHATLPEDAVNQQLKALFQHRWRVTPQFKHLEAAEITRMQFRNNSRKPIKFIDLR